ncbi:hypothetical protein B0H19DRAFT_1149981 [Mycena capillaripes]|nr:hypothetical protein B0H19DRAFT_1149981 [Mycena capillaripes]
MKRSQKPQRPETPDSEPELTYEGFPELEPPLDLSDDTVAIQYYDQLVEARRVAKLHELQSGLCFDFDLTIPPSNPIPRARSLPHFLHQSTISFRLAQPLQTGPDKNSQVWTAVGDFAGAQTTVVFKIIQPSMCSLPHADDRWRRMYDYVFPEQFAREEAWVYKQLEHKQGLCIPYFFGLHTITTPSNEHAWVLVLEYIPGETLAAYNESPTKSLSDSCDLLKLSIDALMEFMAEGWCHHDAMPRNITVTGSPGSRSVVFIDLYFASRFIGKDLEIQRLHRRRRLYNEIRDSLGDPAGEIRLWALQNLDL